MNKYLNKLNTKLAGDKDFSEIIRGSSTSFFMKVIGLCCAQLFALIVARLFGADVWGGFSLALSVITIGSILGTLGLDIGNLKLSAGTEKIFVSAVNYRNSFFLTIGASLLVTLFVYFSAERIAIDIFSKPDLTETFRIASFAIIPFSLVKLNSQVLRGLKEITHFVFLSFVARYLFSLVLLLLFINLIIIEDIVLISFITSLYLIFLLSSYWLFKKGIIYNTELKETCNETNIKFLLKISLPLLFASSLVFLKGWVDTIMVGIFLTSTDVGIYHITLKLSGLLTIVLTAVNSIAAPKFAEVYAQKNNNKLQLIISYSTKIIFFTSLPLFLIFILIPEAILSIFGDEFKEGSIVLILLSVGNLFNALSGSVGYLMQMTDSQLAFQNIMLATTITGISLNFILIPIFGMEGAAISTCVTTIFWNLTCVLFIQKKYNLKTYYIPFSK